MMAARKWQFFSFWGLTELRVTVEPLFPFSITYMDLGEVLNRFL